MILSPAAIVGLRQAEAGTADACSGRYGRVEPPGPELAMRLSAAAPPAPAPAAGPGGADLPAAAQSAAEAPQASGAPAVVVPPLERALEPQPAMWAEAPQHPEGEEGGAAHTEALVESPRLSSDAAPSTARDSHGSAPVSPRGGTSCPLRTQLQQAFQRIDTRGSGLVPTSALVRSLHTLLASQTASTRASRSWSNGLRQICVNLDAHVDTARLSGDESAQTGWDELLSLADGVQS
jgi:hypothetical protein